MYYTADRIVSSEHDDAPHKQIVKEIEKKLDFTARIYKPKGCETLDDFNRIYGTHQALSHADFDQHSKIDPLMLAFADADKKVVITGRRADQVRSQLIPLFAFSIKPRSAASFRQYLVVSVRSIRAQPQC